MDVEKKTIRSAKRRRRKKIITIVVIVLVVAGGLTGTVLLLRQRVTERFGSEDASDVSSAQVTVGSISTTVSGSGTLGDEDAEEIKFPAALILDEVFVEEGESVEEGRILASVNTASLLSALAAVQTELDDLDDEITDAASDTVSSTVKAGVAGRVKKVCAAAGESVSSVMVRDGALALLSLDGKMAVRLASDAAAAGEKVTVRRADGSELAGVVESAADGALVVTLTDDGTALGESVTVLAPDGSTLGTGELYIHNELKITGYAGTVSYVTARENAKVSASTALFRLTDTATSASYDALLRSRREKEAELQKLIDIYREGALYAPCAGVIGTVSYDPDALSTEESEETETLLLTLLPNEKVSVTISVDESKILSIVEGQSATVTVDSLGDEEFSGTVLKVDTSSGSSSGGVTRYSVEVELPKDARMLAGMSASVAIRIESVDNALTIPSDALYQTRTSTYVYTSYNAETDELGGQLEVTAGLDNGTSVIITSGLAEGDTVWYEPSASKDNNMFMMQGGGFSSSQQMQMPSGGFSGGERPSGGGSGSRPSGFGG